MKKQTITLLLIIGTIMATYSQNGIRFSASQDLKMFFKGVTETNDNPALNTLIRFRLEGNQTKAGFLSLIPAFEYAELQPAYKRYSLNLGYTFNNIGIKNVEVGTYVGYGVINRFRQNLLSFGYGIEPNYVWNDFKIGLIFQATHRTDLGFRYDDKRYVYSTFLNVTYSIFKK